MKRYIQYDCKPVGGINPMLWENSNNRWPTATHEVAKNRHQSAHFTAHSRALLPPHLSAKIGSGGAGRRFSNLIEMATCHVRWIQCESECSRLSHAPWNAAPVARKELPFQGRPSLPTSARFHAVYRARIIFVDSHPAGALSTERTGGDGDWSTRWNQTQVLRQFNWQSARQFSLPFSGN